MAKGCVKGVDRVGGNATVRCPCAQLTGLPAGVDLLPAPCTVQVCTDLLVALKLAAKRHREPHRAGPLDPLLLLQAKRAHPLQPLLGLNAALQLCPDDDVQLAGQVLRWDGVLP